MKKFTKDIAQVIRETRGFQAAVRSREVEEEQVKSSDFTSLNTAGLYAKGMTHDGITGLPSLSSITTLILGLETGEQSYFDALDQAGTRKQVSPQASLSIELSGADPEGVNFDQAPSLNSRVAAAEMVEVYEKNLLRDMPFHELNSSVADVSADRAVANLNSFGDDFTGPKDGGAVTRQTLFRGKGEGELIGPYVSQFMLLDVPFGNQTIVQVGPTKTGVYGITEANWLSIQQGNVPVSQTIDSAPKYIYNGRQLGSFVHIDFVYQAFLYGAAILLGNGAARHSAFPALAKEVPFVTGGGAAEIAAAVAEVSRPALKAAWVQKWKKHLKLRPEAMAGRVVKESDGALPSGTVHGDLFTLGASTLSAVKAANVAAGGDNKAWLPIQYAEGSPTHPSYPAGHATIAGACATILKLYFADGAWSTTGLSPVHSLDGNSLVAYAEADAGDLTVHGEINKLASNMSIGRNIAGVHYRSDGDNGLLLGEKIAIQWFKDHRCTQHETIGEVTIIGFDGTEIKV